MRWILGVVIVVWCLFMAFLGFAPGLEVEINDKVLHFFCFGFLTSLIYFFLNSPTLAQNVMRAALAALALGLSSEFVQGLLPYKQFDWLDICANLLGSSVFLGASAAADARLRSRREYRSYTELNRILEEEPLEEV
ncbi:hypothetical protein K493DRAFT_317470 [Basidiobolus meristosporus CBS 931.73]|uniref:Uncharacterized protein n=1 Tax=Basidiobolus meristosporus CBS 931.73 TaxID=1314790 RepID=A0A1Y1XZJ8_9FUNG|nr:hypothetical protein K493DRAFT_317470 [Basidiobolus meristosporus CBS 931.73]|eukprot:ORX91177.1 hypothetical protein K493DRAFT_317470 [Basidiobolus meristosporus CBS 931.73]